MALTYAVSTPEGVHGDIVPGAYKEIYCTITDTSYTTGGDAFSLATLQTLVPALFIYSIGVINHWSAGALAVYNTGTSKLQAFGGTPAAGLIPESAATTNVGTATLRVVYR